MPRANQNLDNMKVYLLFREKDLICVCSSKPKSVEYAVDDAASALLFQEFGGARDFASALREYNHSGVSGVWYEIKEEEVL